MTTWNYTEETIAVHMEMEGIAKAAMKSDLSLEELEAILKEVTEEDDQSLMLPAQMNINDCFVTFTEITNGEDTGQLAEFGATFTQLPTKEDMKGIYPAFHDVLEMMKKYHFVFAMIYSPIDPGGHSGFRFRGASWPVPEAELDIAQDNGWNLSVELQEKMDSETVAAMRMVGLDDLADQYEEAAKKQPKIITLVDK